MVSRIRIDLFGRTAAEVEQQAAAFYNQLTGEHNAASTWTVGNSGATPNIGGTNSGFAGPIFRYLARGEVVIERDMNEPEDSRWAYKGRALFYPDVSTVADAGAPPTFLEEEAA